MKGHAIPYLPQELAWIEARKEMPRDEMHRLFCVLWQRDDVSFQALNGLCKRKGWLTGCTGCFTKGLTPHNKGKSMPPEVKAKVAATMFKPGSMSGRARALHKPIGTERFSKEGYVERKVHDGLPMQSRWRGVHLIRWEAVNGPLPKGHALKCMDGNRLNTDPSNWQVVPRAMLPRLNGRYGRNFDAAPSELKPSIMAVTKLEHAAREAGKGA